MGELWIVNESTTTTATPPPGTLNTNDSKTNKDTITIHVFILPLANIIVEYYIYPFYKGSVCCFIILYEGRLLLVGLVVCKGAFEQLQL